MQMRALKIRPFNDEIRDYNVDIRIAFGQKNEDICPDESPSTNQPCINWLARAWVSAIKQKKRKKERNCKQMRVSLFLSLSRDDTWCDVFIRLESTHSSLFTSFLLDIHRITTIFDTINSNERNSRNLGFSIDKILSTERTTYIYIYITKLCQRLLYARYLGSRANRVVRDISFSGSRV